MDASFSKRNWLILLLFGLIGQLAWSVENMYFNLFLFDTVSQSLDAVTLMVQLSGVTATVVTLIAGTLSDKTRNRRSFISIGYIIWGITVLCFSFITTTNTAKLFNIEDTAKAVTATLAIVVIMDCLMTAFGSTANDACFNAWVTDNTEVSFRGKVESVLSVLPLISMLIVAGGFGILVDLMGYTYFFLLLGAVIIIPGVVGLFIIRDSDKLKTLNGGKYSDIIYGFKPSVIKENAKLYLTLCIVGIYGIACQIFMPYLIIFMKTYLGFSVIEYSVVFGAAIIIGAIFSVLVGRVADKWKKEKVLYICVAILAVGLLAMYLCSNILQKSVLLLMFGIAGTIMIIGYILVSSFTGALVRDFTPEDNVGKMQGIRMIFSVLIPMVIGPMIGNAINAIKAIPLNSSTSADIADTMTTKYIPAPEIFLCASVVAVLSLVFVYLLNRKIRKDNK